MLKIVHKKVFKNIILLKKISFAIEFPDNSKAYLKN